MPPASTPDTSACPRSVRLGTRPLRRRRRSGRQEPGAPRGALLGPHPAHTAGPPRAPPHAAGTERRAGRLSASGPLDRVVDPATTDRADGFGGLVRPARPL